MYDVYSKFNGKITLENYKRVLEPIKSFSLQGLYLVFGNGFGKNKKI